MKESLEQQRNYATLNVYVSHSKSMEKQLKNKTKREKEHLTEMKEKNDEKMFMMKERRTKHLNDFRSRITELNKDNRKKDYIR
jgi:hypothetical protein